MVIAGTYGIDGYVAAPQPSLTPQADSQPALDRTRIREIFMTHGFTVKEGQTDLKQYVYDAAEALLRAARTPAESVTAPAAVVIECGNLYAKVKLTDEAFGTTKVGDKLYRTQASAGASPTEYVLAGWRATLAAQGGKDA